MKARKIVGRKIVSIDHEWIGQEDARIKARKECVRIILDDGSFIMAHPVILEDGATAILDHRPAALKTK